MSLLIASLHLFLSFDVLLIPVFCFLLISLQRPPLFEVDTGVPISVLGFKVRLVYGFYIADDVTRMISLLCMCEGHCSLT